jgi:hypothetical protein
MKTIILSGLSVLLASSLYALPAGAEPTTKPHEIGPVTLVHLGYQGYFEKQGIPGNVRFLLASQSGKVTAVKLVEIAIEANRLPPEALNDANYINGVRNALQENIDHG